MTQLIETPDQPWEKDIHYKATLVAEILSPIIDFQIQDVMPFGEGFDGSLFKVNGEWIFKFARRLEGIDFLNFEKLGLSLLPKLPLEIPRVRYSGLYDGRWPWIGYKLLSGETGENLMLTREDRAEGVQAIGQFLKALHSLDATILRKKGIPNDWLGHLNLEKRIPFAKEILLTVKKKGLVENPTLYEPIVEAVKVIGTNDIEVLAHGDFKIGHLLFEKRKVTAVIDWGDIHIGHPASDLSIAYSYFYPEDRDLFWKAYGKCPPSWRQLAQFRALFHSCAILNYSNSIGAYNLEREARFALASLLTEDPCL